MQNQVLLFGCETEQDTRKSCSKLYTAQTVYASWCVCIFAGGSSISQKVPQRKVQRALHGPPLAGPRGGDWEAAQDHARDSNQQGPHPTQVGDSNQQGSDPTQVGACRRGLVRVVKQKVQTDTVCHSIMVSRKWYVTLQIQTNRGLTSHRWVQRQGLNNVRRVLFQRKLVAIQRTMLEVQHAMLEV